MTYLRRGQFWRAIKQVLWLVILKLFALDGYVLSFPRIWIYFVVKMWNIQGVGAWPIMQVCQNYIWGQFLILLFFDISRWLWIFWWWFVLRRMCVVFKILSITRDSASYSTLCEAQPREGHRMGCLGWPTCWYLVLEKRGGWWEVLIWPHMYNNCVS